ncbi:MULTISPECIES: hypothetical protein [Pantoea]|uniref:hypothetical protein n=2 Tax=Pantoea TaxID=53335 RepID=UPI001CF79674|nr:MULTISPECIES: hypothetical protein [Pantoea]
MSNLFIASLMTFFRRIKQQGRCASHNRIAACNRHADRQSVRAHPEDASLSAGARRSSLVSVPGAEHSPQMPGRPASLWLSRVFLLISLLLPGSGMVSPCSGACYAATNTLITLHFFRRCYESGKPSSGMVKCFSRQLRTVALIRFIHASRNAAPPGKLKRFHYAHHAGKKSVRPPFRADSGEAPTPVSTSTSPLFQPDTLLRQRPAQPLPPCLSQADNAAQQNLFVPQRDMDAGLLPCLH